jgi:hypothetical protein
MSYFEARKGPLALFTDVVWEDLGFSGLSVMTSIAAPPGGPFPDFRW